MSAYSTAELTLISDAVHKDADQRSLDAAYSGAMSDGGASATRSEFDAWMDGYLCGTGKLSESKLYHHIIEKDKKERDPEYQEFLRLKEKFEE